MILQLIYGFALITIFVILYQTKIKIRNIMAKQEQFDAMLVRIDAATNEIASDLKTLRDEVADNISDESLAKLDANISKLEALGADEPQA